MLRKLTLYIITILFFLGPTVYAFIGWQVEGNPNAPSYQKFYPNYFILIFVLLIICPFYSRCIKDISLEIKGTIFTLIIFFFLKLIGGSVTTMIVFNSIGLPILVSAFLCTLNKNDNTLLLNIRNLIILMFIIVSLVAIFERIRMVHLFPLELAYEHASFDIDENRLDQFRSSSLLGHPLSNALILTCIFTFILISDLKEKYKYILSFVGLLALLCFNTRAAIGVYVLSLIIYEIRNYRQKNLSTVKIILFIALFLTCIAAIPLLIESGLGGRLFDDSSQSENSILARLWVWDLLDKFDTSIFVFGLRGGLADFAERALGSVHIENWFLLMSLHIGVIISLIFVFLITYIIKKNTKRMDRFSKWFTIILTILLASTNNSLATGVQVLSIYLICTYSFQKNNRIETLDDSAI